jgi:DNA-binding transcriptional LysR family regulator
MLSLERSPTFREHALRLCAKYGFAPRIVQEAHELPTLFALARAGGGVALVPISACRAGISGVRVHPISDKEAFWTVGAAWRKGENSVLVASFLELLKKELNQKSRRTHVPELQVQGGLGFLKNQSYGLNQSPSSS